MAATTRLNGRDWSGSRQSRILVRTKPSTAMKWYDAHSLGAADGAHAPEIRRMSEVL